MKYGMTNAAKVVRKYKIYKQAFYFLRLHKNTPHKNVRCIWYDKRLYYTIVTFTALSPGE